MGKPWATLNNPSSSEITGAAVADTVAFPELSGDKPSKRQLRYAYLEVAPEVSSSLPIVDAAQEHTSTSASGDQSSHSTVTQEHTFISATDVEGAKTVTQEHNLVTGLQTGSIKKDWSPVDDAETCHDLLITVEDPALSQPRERLSCFIQICEDGELPKAEPVAQKPSTTGTANLSARSTHGSSSEQSSQDDRSTGGADNEPTTGTFNLSTSTHGSSSSEHKHQYDESTGGADNAALDAALDDPVAFPLLTGEKQSKRQMRNAHLPPSP